MMLERHTAVLAMQERQIEGARTYVVLGEMRGGTSMVAGVMHGLGIDLGPQVSEQNHESTLLTGKNSIEDIRATIARYNEDNAIWAWKYPHAANYLDAVWNEIRNPHLICVFRDVAANAAGLTRWGHSKDPLNAINAVLNRQKKNLQLLKKHECPALLISYEKALRHKNVFVEQLADWIGVGVDYGAFDFDGFMQAESYKNIADYRK